jgi:hypothetical protein
MTTGTLGSGIELSIIVESRIESHVIRRSGWILRAPRAPKNEGLYNQIVSFVYRASCLTQIVIALLSYYCQNPIV